MTLRSTLTVLALVATGSAAFAVAQERVKPKQPADFAGVHAAIKRDFDAGHYGKAFRGANELAVLIGVKRSSAIREALPAAPQGYEKVPFEEPKDQGQQNRMLMSLGVGNVIEQAYRGTADSKGKAVTVTVTADSPFLQMFQMVLNNPAMLPPNQELIKYGDVMAILETSGDNRSLKILLDNNMVEAKFRGQEEDFVFAMWDQAAVDKVEAAILD